MRVGDIREGLSSLGLCKGLLVYPCMDGLYNYWNYLAGMGGTSRSQSELGFARCWFYW
jgi:hypothetical protein